MKILPNMDVAESCQRCRKSGKEALLLIYEGILTPTLVQQFSCMILLICPKVTACILAFIRIA